MGPVLGPQLGDLASLMSRDNRANSQGSAYGGGWYGYVDKDLRTLLDARSRGGSRRTSAATATWPRAATRCTRRWTRRRSSWRSWPDPNPDDWRADAAAERIFFSPGFLGTTMRWTNRPTFQQAISYSSHR